MNKIHNFFLCSLLCFFIIFPIQSSADPPPPRYNQNGRTMLMIFSGYYGWWTGIVAHEAWGVKWSIKTKKDNLPLAPLLTTPVALVSTYFLTRNRPVTRAHANMIMLGGHLGTWQGLGWANLNDVSSDRMLNIGTIAGISGAGLGLLANTYMDFSPGGSMATHTSMYWGAWLGYLSGVLLDMDGDDLLMNSLVSTDIFVATTAALLCNTSMSEREVATFNGLGASGGVIAWLGYLLITGEKGKYDGKTAAAVTAAGHAAGFLYAAITYRGVSGGQRRAIRKFQAALSPVLMGNQNPANKVSRVPGINIRCCF